MTDVHSFVEEHEWGADALAAVLASAEAGDGTVRWADVSDDLDSTQWGTLVQRGLLVDAGDAFVVDDPTAVAEVVGADDGDPTAVAGAAGDDDQPSAVDADDDETDREASD